MLNSDVRQQSPACSPPMPCHRVLRQVWMGGSSRTVSHAVRHTSQNRYSRPSRSPPINFFPLYQATLLEVPVRCIGTDGIEYGHEVLKCLWHLMVSFVIDICSPSLDVRRPPAPRLDPMPCYSILRYFRLACVECRVPNRLWHGGVLRSAWSVISLFGACFICIALNNISESSSAMSCVGSDGVVTDFNACDPSMRPTEIQCAATAPCVVPVQQLPAIFTTVPEPTFSTVRQLPTFYTLHTDRVSPHGPPLLKHSPPFQAHRGPKIGHGLEGGHGGGVGGYQSAGFGGGAGIGGYQSGGFGVGEYGSIGGPLGGYGLGRY
jgi:hypothetical protein